MASDGRGFEEERIVTTTCTSHCGGSCLLKVHVKGGVITRIETDDGDSPQFRACLRGRAYRQRVYHPERLLYPMRRSGERGEGKFERISWDEALDTVAKELIRVRDTYGPAAILHQCLGGDLHLLHSGPIIYRLLCMLGGCTDCWGTISYEGAVFSAMSTYGNIVGTTNTRDDLLKSRLIILWGWNPAATIHRCNTAWYLAQAREMGARIVSVDPRYTDSAATFAHDWIPIKPGTDAAMLIAMAYVVIRENLQDQRFLDTYTVGFDRFREYVLGEEDGIAKTPPWAETISGVPAEKIELLARDYATTKPAALMAGIAPGRTAYGEQYHRAASTLAAMTGNVGIHGGDAAAATWAAEYWGGDTPAVVRYIWGFRPGVPSPDNPVMSNAPFRLNSLPRRGAGVNNSVSVNRSRYADAVLKGKDGGYFSDYKLLYVINTNYLNQMPNVNKTVQAFKTLEFIVVQEQFMTPTARFADILLPTCTFLERNDFTAGGATPFFSSVNKVIDPIGESKSHLEIGIALAERLGLSGYNDKTEEEWLRQITAIYTKAFHVPDYDILKKEGIYKVQLGEPQVAFKQQIDDPKSNPFSTPSGKIEIYSQQIAEMNNPLVPSIPKFIEPWEGPGSPLSQKYPLQLITTHFKRRAHSQFENLPWLREVETQALLMNPVDAGTRGIEDGDTVRVFNDRGQVAIPVRLTERIMPGVADMPQGAWYSPDEQGVDRGGCANVLTRDETSPVGALCFNSCLVEVEKC